MPRGQIWATRLRPSLSEDGNLALDVVLDSLDDFQMRDSFVTVDEPDPLCLLAVNLECEEPLDDILTAGTETSQPTVSWNGLLRLTDEILHLATLALGDVAPEHTYGQLAYADLVGAGVLRLSDPDGHPVDLPILPRPQLGSWQPGSDADVKADKEQEEVRAVFGDLRSSRRLLAWSSRFALRRARGEWAEAIVALKAAVEAAMWAILEGVLIDYGWESTDLTGKDVPGNAKAAIAALQSHLGGNWTLVRDDFAALWVLRNGRCTEVTT